jgi:TonB-linked SusC/RagA family outer membrane protein
MKKHLMMIVLFLVTGLFAAGQTVQITGVVSSSEDGLPLPGVTVKVQGITIGATTDYDGVYTIQVPAGSTALEFSFIGMESQVVQIDGRTKIDVVLKPDLFVMDEVVVVGYGTAKKVGTVVGSLTQVSSEQIKEKPVANVFDGLQGKVAGLQVFTSSGEPSEIASIRLHGTGSLSGGSTPLYVLDGIPIDAGTMLSLNANDFESVTILKDASATSIYGTRAANGVVYITTKKGKIDTKGVIKINTQYGSTSLADTDFFEGFCNTAELTGFWVANGYRTQAQVDNLLTTYPNDTKWYKYYYKDSAPTFQGDLSISGGGGKTTYYISGSYFTSEGLADRSLFERYTLRSNVTTKVNDWLSFGVNLTGSTDKRATNGYGSNSTNRGLAMLAQPFYTPYDENGEEYPDYIPGWGRYNPEYLAKMFPLDIGNVQFDGGGYIQVNPIEGLTIKTQAGMDAYDYRRTQKRMPSYIASLNNGYLQEDFSRGITKTITNTAEYKFTLASIHNFTVLAGHEYIDYNYESFYGYSAGQTDDRLMLLGNGPNSRDVSSSKSEYAFLSYFGRIDYSFNDKYFVDFSARRDASSRFGKDNRVADFYAGGVMWNAKKEPFLQDVAFLSSLNIKASIGTSGNAGSSNYAHLALIGTNQYDSETGWVLSSPGNSALGWENQIKSTLGFRFSFFRDKYRFNIELYDRKTSNMLVSVPFPYTTGFNNVLSNVGTLQNRGIDFAFDFDIVKTPDFYITPYVNFNYNSEKVLELFQDREYWNIPNTGVTWVVGQPVSFFYPYFAGIDPADGSPMWYVPSSDPTETSTDETTKTFNSAALQQNLGKPRYAPFNGGFGINIGFKGLALQSDFAFSKGKYLINNDRYFYENPTAFAGFNQSRRILDYWQEPGDESLFPRYGVQFTQFDSRLVEDASFLRMKNISLSYRLPAELLRKTNFFTAARVFVSGRNLLTFTKYLGPDPEVDSNLSLGANPNTKQFTFGAEITF